MKCTICQTPIWQEGAGRPKITCSKKCKNKRDGQAELAKRPTFKVDCSICSKTFLARRKDQHTCSKECSKIRNNNNAIKTWQKIKTTRPEFKIRECQWCNKELRIPSNQRGVVKYHDECRKPARQSQYRVKWIRRDYKKAAVKISHDEIAERDSYTCHICLKLVDMTLARTSRFGATLDHVIPLSKGGEDTLANVKLAHWICNVRKSNKIEGELNA